MQNVKIIRLLDKNKAKFAFLAPLVLALGSSLSSWAVTGDFNEAEIRTAVGGTILAGSAGIAAYLAKTHEALAKVNGPASPPQRR